MLGGHQDLAAMPSPADVNTTMLVMDGAQAPRVQLAQTQAPPQTPQTSDPAAAPSAQTAADEPIGNVATLTGTVTVIRNKNSLPLKLRDDVYFNDTVQTST